MRPEDVASELVEKGMRATGMWSKRRDLGEQTVRDVLAAVLPEIQAQALRDHRKRVDRFYGNQSLIAKALVLGDLDDYAARLTAETEEPTDA